MAINKLGHVGIYARDLLTMRKFYTDVVGLKIADEDLDAGAVFMSSNPDAEHHEFVLFRSPDLQTCVQQISFNCEQPQDVVEYYHRFKAAGVQFDRVVSHGNALGLYFFDPEGNRREVYWTTPYKAHQPYSTAVDLSRRWTRSCRISSSTRTSTVRPAIAIRRSSTRRSRSWRARASGCRCAARPSRWTAIKPVHLRR